ncbi:MAG TPA: RagB/SusD family nutrient uptake outer membrane protein [Dyadobacter sp.]|nr:RagB/SusD family nutrient uptake outer membrane protein [Dyadobacter sp.]
MRLNKLILSLLTGVTACLTACDDAFLDTKPTDIISDQAIWADSALADAYVVGRYVGVQLSTEGDKPGFGRGFEDAWMSSVTDESICNFDNDTYFVQQGNAAPDRTGWISNTWTRGYRSIRECNYGLANLDKVPMSESGKKRLKAELRFIRAYRYHDLIRNFGGIPIIGDKVYTLEDRDYTELYQRKSIEESITYAVSELDAAAAGLAGATVTSGRGSENAALALKARLLLYAASPLFNNDQNDAAKWQKAADAAKVVIDKGAFSLYNDYRKLFITNNTSEDIFIRLYSPTNEHTNLELVNGPNGYGGWAGNTPLQNLVDDYEMMDGTKITDPKSGYNPKEPYKNRDPRLTMTVLYNGAAYRERKVETFVPGGQDSKDGNENWNTTKTGYYVYKFINDQNPIRNANQTATQPWKYLRYGEVLLNYAEARNEAAGPDATVYSAINQIRKRAGMPDLPAGLTQAAMRERIRNERRVELAFEEHRFFDVRRWKIANVTENVPAYGVRPEKKPDGSIEYVKIIALEGRKFQDKNYWQPIPQSEIQASGGALKQNAGY